MIALGMSEDTRTRVLDYAAARKGRTRLDYADAVVQTLVGAVGCLVAICVVGYDSYCIKGWL